MKRLLAGFLKFQQREKILFWSILLAVIAYASFIAYQSEIEAFPELTNVQVQVITQYSGKAAEEVERHITAPLEVAMTGIPGLINTRSISIFGLSVITLTFDDKAQTKQSRMDVFQRFADVDLPDGVKPSLSPDTTPVGEVFRYTVEGALPSDELRLIEDWTLEREFKSIAGVADVVSFGGPVRTIEVQLNLPQMTAMGLTLTGVAQALSLNHANAGGGLITHGEETYVVRSLGLYDKTENLEDAIIGTQHNVPVRVRDLGKVQIGHRPRMGQVGKDKSDDVAEGIILLRQGADTLRTCEAIREKIELLNHSILPKGVKIVPYYDRTNLISLSSHTVFHNILFGVLLVVVILTLGLGLRCWALILSVAFVIPFALLIAFVGLKLCGYSPNLISLGAVDFGILIETAIFAAEAVVHARSRKSKYESAIEESTDLASSIAAILGPALVCALLLVIAFIPILSLQRVEGRIFKPLGVTLISALVGGQLGALIFIPLGSLVTPLGAHPLTWVDRTLERACSFFEVRVIQISSIRFLRLIAGGLLGVAILLLLATLGREFLPQLNEGSLYIRATAPPTISREKSVDLAAKIRERLHRIPEVVNVVSQIGRPDDGTDVNGFDNIEILVTLSEPDTWHSSKNIEGFIFQGQKLLSDLPGVSFNFSQPIKDNVDEAISGVKGELVVKIFGSSLPELQKIADQVSEILQKVEGAEDVAAEQLLGQPELRFAMNREILGRYGLKVADAEDVLETAMMGKFATKMSDSFGRLTDVVVRPDASANESEMSLPSLKVMTPDGGKISLGEISRPTLVEGVSRIYREQGERRVAVKASVRGRAVVDFVNQASRQIKDQIQLPSKYRMTWSGSFENAQRAGQQFLIIVPLCMLALVIVLYTWFKNWSHVGLLLWEVPFSLVGALAALKMSGLNLSVSASAGGIVLIGVSLLTGMMYISDWIATGDALESQKNTWRGILISNGVAIVGLIPASLSHGIGAETARPFAVMILGGLVSSLILSVVLLPAFCKAKNGRKDLA